MYGIDKTLLVPLVQPSVDIVQGQVSAKCPLLALVPPSCREGLQPGPPPVSPVHAHGAEKRCYFGLKQVWHARLCMPGWYSSLAMLAGEGDCSRKALPQAAVVWPGAEQGLLLQLHVQSCQDAAGQPDSRCSRRPI